MNAPSASIVDPIAASGTTPHHSVIDHVFRDYDIRGLAPEQISPSFALLLGRAVGNLVMEQQHQKIFVARDGRLSSESLADSLRQGLCASGCDVIDLGVTTTPVLNFAIRHQGSANCGVIVTASHNPGHYNGFKIIFKDKVFSGIELQSLKEMMKTEKFSRASKGNLSQLDISPKYLQHIVDNCQLKSPLNLVIDGGNAVCGPLAETLLPRLNCSVKALFCDINGHFPHHEPNPSEEKNLQSLIATVKETKADLGLAFDGDGDRVVAVSQQGRIVWPDQLMMLFAQSLLADNPSSRVVFDVKSSMKLPQLIRAHGGEPIMCKTGHAHVRQAVQQSKALLGGEFSGHIFFNDRWGGFDDGLYAAVRLLEILSQSEHSLDDLIDQFPSTSYTPEILIPVADEKKFALMADILGKAKFTGGSASTLDGLRIDYTDGWGLIRASNTTPNLTLRFEAETDDGLTAIKQQFLTALTPFIHQLENYL